MSTTNSILRARLNNLATRISTLAGEASNRLTNGSGVIDVASELVKETLTFTFAIGQLHEAEGNTQTATTSSGNNVQVKVGSSRSNPNYHNVRDSRGRFTRV